MTLNSRVSTVDSADVSFLRDGDHIRGYAAWPNTSERLPGLVLIPDVRGLSEHYRDVARRFAAGGFPRGREFGASVDS